jgi:deoxyhypusine synthase
MERGLVNVIVSTAANITHDFANALLGQSHYIGSDEVDDDELWDYRINRIYDTYLPERALYDAQVIETNMLEEIYAGQDGPVLPSDVFYELGSRIETRSMVSVAAATHVPIFCGAHSDSDFGLNLAEAKMRQTVNVVLDEIGDILKFTELAKKYPKHGLIIVGGGVPRSWAQQIFPFMDKVEENEPDPSHAYKYCILIQAGVPYDGGMSGTLVPADKSWGRYASDVSSVNIWCDATIALPLLVTALVQRKKAGKI